MVLKSGNAKEDKVSCSSYTALPGHGSEVCKTKASTAHIYIPFAGSDCTGVGWTQNGIHLYWCEVSMNKHSERHKQSDTGLPVSELSCFRCVDEIGTVNIPGTFLAGDRLQLESVWPRFLLGTQTEACAFEHRLKPRHLGCILAPPVISCVTWASYLTFSVAWLHLSMGISRQHCCEYYTHLYC